MPRVQEEIKQDIVDQLAWDDRVNAAEVDVEVTFNGTVPNGAAYRAVMDAALFTAAVVDVHDDLTVAV